MRAFIIVTFYLNWLLVQLKVNYCGHEFYVVPRSVYWKSVSIKDSLKKSLMENFIFMQCLEYAFRLIEPFPIEIWERKKYLQMIYLF